MAKWTIFLPAICLYPIWITIGFENDQFSVIPTYYPMMLAMVLGSMIAGSTPLGGGVVAFPVSVLALGFSPTEGRDFSLMIQSVGMTAAAFLLFFKKQHLLVGHGDLTSKLILFNVIGVIIGLQLLGSASPYIVNIVYTTTVVCLVFIFMYQDFAFSQISISEMTEKALEDTITDAEGGGGESIREENTSSPNHTSLKRSDEGGSTRMTLFLHFVCLPLFAIAGGMLTTQIGSGADIASYFYGSLVNTISSRKMCENSLTAVSVIIMACASVVGSILRLTTQEVDDKVFSVLFACSPIVVLGAPIGSLFLSPSNQKRLKHLFYALGIMQLFSFGVIKIGKDILALIAVAGVICTVLVSLLIHHIIVTRWAKENSITSKECNTKLTT